MNDTLTLALVTGTTGLLGALIGAWVTMWVDRRRRADERLGFSDTIRMDLEGYAETCRRLADEWIVDPRVRPPPPHRIFRMASGTF